MTHRKDRGARWRWIVGGWLLIGGLACGEAVAQVPQSLPDGPVQVMLIKNAVTAVNHGAITGNYTVLRDLASERFRQQNTAIDLGNTFSSLQTQKLDLSPILVTEPRLVQQPGVDQRGRFHLVGYFPTKPQAVQFALIFQPVAGGWLIDEITLGVKPLESLVQSQRLPQPAPQNAGAPLSPDPRSAPPAMGRSAKGLV